MKCFKCKSEATQEVVSGPVSMYSCKAHVVNAVDIIARIGSCKSSIDVKEYPPYIERDYE